MKLAELFNPILTEQGGPYKVRGIEGTHIVLQPAQSSLGELRVELSGVRLDKDSMAGGGTPLLRPGNSQLDQDRIIQSIGRNSVVVVKKHDTDDPIQYTVSRRSGDIIYFLDPQGDPTSQIPVEINPPTNAVKDYYVDSDNSSGMIHFEPDRSIAEKGRLVSQWKANGTPVMVE